VEIVDKLHPEDRRLQGRVPVRYTGRLFRQAKAPIAHEVAEIFERLGSSAETWRSRQQKPSEGSLVGWVFAASRERLRQVAKGLGLKRVANQGGCIAF
jgi:hypothetical protein